MEKKFIYILIFIAAAIVAIGLYIASGYFPIAFWMGREPRQQRQTSDYNPLNESSNDQVVSTGEEEDLKNIVNTFYYHLQQAVNGGNEEQAKEAFALLSKEAQSLKQADENTMQFLNSFAGVPIGGRAADIPGLSEEDKALQGLPDQEFKIETVDKAADAVYEVSTVWVYTNGKLRRNFVVKKTDAGDFLIIAIR